MHPKLRPDLIQGTLTDLRSKGAPRMSKTAKGWVPLDGEHSSPSKKKDDGAGDAGDMNADKRDEGEARSPKDRGSPSGIARAGSGYDVEHEAPASPTQTSIQSSAGKSPRYSVQSPIPRQYVSEGISSLPPQYLVHFLTKAEPISLSFRALQVYKDQVKAKYVPKIPLLRLFERVTGLGPDDPVTPSMREVPEMEVMVVNMNIERGRPLREKTMPAIWQRPEYGVYKLEFFIRDEGGKSTIDIEVTNQVTQKKQMVPRKFSKTVKDKTRVYVEYNWSEKNAVIVDGAGVARYNLYWCFIVADNEDKEAALSVEALHVDDEDSQTGSVTRQKANDVGQGVAVTNDAVIDTIGLEPPAPDFE